MNMCLNISTNKFRLQLKTEEHNNIDFCAYLTYVTDSMCVRMVRNTNKSKVRAYFKQKTTDWLNTGMYTAS